MAKQPGFFDMDERMRRLSDPGDQLEAYAGTVEFEIFRADLEAALVYPSGAKGVRGLTFQEPRDPIAWQAFTQHNAEKEAQNNLSDDRAEFLIHCPTGSCIARSRKGATDCPSCGS